MQTVIAEINWDKTFQIIKGFGGSLRTWELQSSYLDEKWYDTLVFDLGVSVVRILASQSTYTREDGCLNRGTFAPRMAMAREFKKRGASTFFTSVFSPPWWQKTNRTTFHGGALRPDMREQFADFVVKWIRAARDFGIEFHGITLQNELHFVEPYHSCVYNPVQFREVLRAVNRRFLLEGMDTYIIGPEDMGFADRFEWFTKPLLRDAETSNFQGFYCTHGGRDGMEDWRQIRSIVTQTQKPLWQTENEGFRSDWCGCMALAREMYDALVGANISVWCINYLDDILVEDFRKTGYEVNKHFMRYIRPGMYRVQANPEEGDLVISCYRNPDGSNLTSVLINSLDEERQVVVRLPSFAPAQWKAFLSDMTHKFAGRDVHFDGNNVTVIMPPQSVITLCGGRDVTYKDAAGSFGIPETNRFVKKGKEFLFQAVDRENTELVMKLIAEGACVHERHISDAFPLHNAAYGSKPEHLRLLVEAGADTEAREDKHMTPMMLAARRMITDNVKVLLECGAEVEAMDYNGWTALHHAAGTGIEEMVEALLEHGAVVNVKAYDGWTPLHAAVASPYKGSYRLAEKLIRSGADPKAVTNDGWTVLHAAAANCCKGYMVPPQMSAHIMELLIASGAEVNAVDQQGNTPLHLAAWLGHSAFVEQGLPRSCVFDDVIHVLVKNGAKVDAVNDKKRMPLHLAAMEGYDAIAAALLSYGADPCAVDDEGMTAVDYARKYYFDDIVDILEGKKEYEDIAMAETKIEVKADHEQKLGNELRKAVKSCNSERVIELIREGADPNATDSFRTTALHMAAKMGHKEMVLLLLEAGADKSAQNSDGFTPVNLSQQNGRREVTEILANWDL